RALELVRQALGPDAIILSSTRTPEGVELMTTLASDNELKQIQSMNSAPIPVSIAASIAAPTTPDAETSLGENLLGAFKGLSSSQPGLASGKTGQQLADEIEQARLRMLA